MYLPGLTKMLGYDNLQSWVANLAKALAIKQAAFNSAKPAFAETVCFAAS